MGTASPITFQAFDAYLRCRTKFYLLDRQVMPLSSSFTEATARIDANYRVEAVLRLRASFGCDVIDYEQIKDQKLCGQSTTLVDCRNCYYIPENRSLNNTGERRLWLSYTDQTFSLILFSMSDKIATSHRLLLSFAALAVAQLTGKVPRIGRLCMGIEYQTKTIDLSNYIGKVSAMLDEIAQLRAKESAPSLVINKHCPMCDFHSLCRQDAIDSDNLSLISTLGEKERRKANEKGIFTVTQLSYSYRPRRRRRMRSEVHLSRNKNSAKHDCKLKALAIKKKQIHVTGTASLVTDGTPVYIDVEGIPGRDFYYLIGLRYTRGNDTIEARSGLTV